MVASPGEMSRSKKGPRADRARRAPQRPAAHAADPRRRGLHSPRLQLVLYSLLLVATPFILLRNFLQDAIGRLSAATVTLAGIDLPVVLLTAGGLLAAHLLCFRPRLTGRRLLAAALALAMVALAQQFTDYYFGHRFYELQQNWHFIAYALFAFFVFRDQRSRGASPARFAGVTIALAAAFSTFDEGFQLFISNRVFDMGDIAKDVWGALIGVTAIFVGREPAAPIAPEPGGSTACASATWGALSWQALRQTPLRHRRLAAYLHHAPSLWLQLTALGFVFLVVSSLLTEIRYAGAILLVTGGIYAVCFTLFHLSQYRAARIALTAALLIAIAIQSFSFARQHDQGITHARPGLLVYRGIPVPFFDVMIFPDGRFRLVDKKHYFSNRDRTFFLRLRPDIIVIGAGHEGLGGRGFPRAATTQFLYNPFTRRGTQVIILDTPDACRRCNELREAGKRVLCVLHTTC